MKKKILLALLAVVLSTGGWFAYVAVFRPAEWWHEYLPSGSGEPLSVLVKPGMNAAEAAREFEAAGVLSKGKASDLGRWMTRFAIDRRLKPGLYTLRRGSPWEVARQLEKTLPSVESVTIIPGSDIFSFPLLFDPAPEDKALRDILSRDGLFPKDVAPFLPSAAEGRLAFLLPETVYVAQKTPEESVERAAKLWWQRIGALIPEERRTKEYLQQRAIVASLVEREALWDDERPLIAGVVENRLEKNMLLQVDATVVYAWKIKGKELKRVLYKHLEIDSPYNTYIIPGLPPAPICIPSEKSWLAAIFPEETKFLYYVAGKDGKHLFSTSLKGHQENIQKVRSK